jgi:hypothetical protein
MIPYCKVFENKLHIKLILYVIFCSIMLSVSLYDGINTIPIKKKLFLFDCLPTAVEESEFLRRGRQSYNVF